MVNKEFVCRISITAIPGKIKTCNQPHNQPPLTPREQT
jgi:hypothetical protein